MSDPLTDLLVVPGILEDVELPCFVGGSVACSFFGEARSTLDVDIVVALLPDDAERLVHAFPADRFYVPPIEVVRREAERGSAGSFNLVDHVTFLKADIYPAGRDPLNAYGFAHAIDHEIGGRRVRIAPPTYLCAMKLRWWAMSHQDKHLRDIRGLLAISPELIDPAVVEQWAAASGTLPQWQDCRTRAGEE